VGHHLNNSFSFSFRIESVEEDNYDPHAGAMFVWSCEYKSIPCAMKFRCNQKQSKFKCIALQLMQTSEQEGVTPARNVKETHRMMKSLRNRPACSVSLGEVSLGEDEQMMWWINCVLLEILCERMDIASGVLFRGSYPQRG